MFTQELSGKSLIYVQYSECWTKWLPPGTAASQEKYRRLFESVQKAWSLVKDKLQYHGWFFCLCGSSTDVLLGHFNLECCVILYTYIPMHARYFHESWKATDFCETCCICSVHLLSTDRLPVKQEYILPALTEEIPLEYLIPTTTGAGVCTFALVDFLMYTHNNFIELCMSTDKSMWVTCTFEIITCTILHCGQQKGRT